MRKFLLTFLLLLLAGAANAQPMAARLLPTLTTAPDIDFNFTLGNAMDSRIPFTRASVATDSRYTDAAGSSFNSFITNQARIDANGLLMEEARTNRLLNSAAPVTQTTASLATGTYVFWCIGTGSVTTSAGTATGTGFGAQACSSSSFQTIVLTVAGTVTATVSGTVNRFQLELGAIPTTFIQTTGAVATRSADVAQVTPGDWFASDRGTWLAEGTLFQTVGATTSQGMLTLFNGATNDRLTLRNNGGTAVVVASFVIAGSTGYAPGSSTLPAPGFMTPNTPFRVMVSYRPSSQQMASLGKLPNRSASNTVLPDNPNRLQLGTGTVSGFYANGYVRRVTYWRQPLTPGELVYRTQYP